MRILSCGQMQYFYKVKLIFGWNQGKEGLWIK